MNLTREFKKQANGLDNRTEKKSLIEKAGRLLADDEIQQVSGGTEQDTNILVTGEDDSTPNPLKRPR